MTALNDTAELWTVSLEQAASATGASSGEYGPDCCWLICNICCWLLC